MIVVDASVGIKWLKQNEQYAKIALRFYRHHLENKNLIIVPSLFFLEIANVLAVTKDISETTMKEGLKLLNKSGFKLHSFTKDNLIDASLLAKKYSTTVFASLYAIVAKEQKCTLITADEQFLKKTRFSFVKLLQSFE